MLNVRRVLFCINNATAFLYTLGHFWHFPAGMPNPAIPSEKNAHPEAMTVTLASGIAVSIPIHRSARAKRLRMRHSTRNGFTLTAPLQLSRPEIARLVPDFLAWMEKIACTGQFLPVEAKLPNALSLPFFGLECAIARDGNLASGRRLANGASFMTGHGAKRVLINLRDGIICFYGYIEDDGLLVAALRAWLRKLASIHFPRSLQNLAAAANYGAIKTIVRDQRSRWGSCSQYPDMKIPTISLNWRGILLQPALFEHLCWHELAHLKHMNHSAEFRAELAAHSPQWRRNEKALNEAWRNLPSWAV